MNTGVLIRPLRESSPKGYIYVRDGNFCFEIKKVHGSSEDDPTCVIEVVSYSEGKKYEKKSKKDYTVYSMDYLGGDLD